ncbi:extracellular solute-binding protein [Paenibacillus ginsengarvi]|uniref:Extracellular solute-binding protein n=1 Tax=Paenibacillus ginsengarvi TaxID=400777 RepID=A0A3B0BSL5_9BACL|nr:extracellular solute-binding protein [Paenibacillus ginsengarvi]RKN75830.1 extracellular solute-binding protein [Paenibacillus ginsengarvi]
MQKKVVRKHSQSRIEEMVQTIRGEIITNVQAIGTHLPSESDLEKRFKLGNTSVRKGLEQLVREGLIRKIPRVGNLVVGMPPAEEATVRLGVYSTTELEMDLPDLLEKFHQRYPNVRVETVMIPTSEYAGYIQRHMAEGTLDAAIMNHNTIRQFSREMRAELLEPLAPNPGQYPFASEPFTVDGRLLVRPLIFSPLVVCYNRDHLKECDLREPAGEWSWNELMELASQVAVDGSRFGFCFQLLSRNRWPVFLLQSGIDFSPDEHGEYRLPEEALTDSLSVCRRLVEQTNVFPAMLSGLDSMAIEWFKDGKVSMIMTTYFSLNHLRQTGIAFDVARLPHSRVNANLLAVIGAVVSRQSRRKEAAVKLVDFLGGKEAQLAIRSRTFSIPALREAAEWVGEADVPHPEHFGIFTDMIPSYRLLEHLKLSTVQLRAIQKQFELYLTGLQNAAAMSRGMERALSENRPGAS